MSYVIFYSTFHFFDGKYFEQFDSVLIMFNGRINTIIGDSSWTNERQFHLDL